MLLRTAAAAPLLLLLLWIMHDNGNNAVSGADSSSQPNIILILADDLGWSDVGWRNPFMHTPTLDRMAREGLILNQSYAHRSCSPSRAALMTGRYAHRLGLQEETISSTHIYHLPDDEPILPEALKSLGYATHMIGKWHLGFCNWKYTPTYRGFDSFYGFYNAIEDYYNHSVRGGYDFRDDDQVDKTAIGKYSTNLFTDRAVRVINQHDTSKPLFLYLAYQAVHGPLQAPQSYMDDNICSRITDNDRRIKCGMIAALDEGVKNVTEALEQRGLMNNTFIVFSSDNGGSVHVASSNWPLRGSKITIWEGGARVTGFVYAPSLLRNASSSYEELLHITDWYPTFVEAAGGNSSIPDIDGVSQWNSLLRGHAGPRHEFIYNINEVKNYSGIRQGRFKLIEGYPGNPNGWFVTPELEKYVNATTEELHTGAHAPPYQLFNLYYDPWERNNIVDSHQGIVQKMKARLDEYRAGLVPTKTSHTVSGAKPSNFEGNWSPGWC